MIDGKFGSVPSAPQSSPDPDSHGRAALVLVESLIHALVGASAMRLPDALEVLSVAIDVEIEVAAERGASSPVPRSVTMLRAIRRSLAHTCTGEQRLTDPDPQPDLFSRKPH